MPTNNTRHPIGLHCPRTFAGNGPYVKLLEKWFDDKGYERGKRINGFDECPKCGLWWPCEEEPDWWQETAEDSLMFAIGWWGYSICCDCNLLLITQPDGTPEAYQL